MKYLKAIQMKYQKLSLIPTQNLDTLASIGRVVTFPIQPIYYFGNKYMRLTDGFNCFPLEVQYKCIKCGHIINFTYNMYHCKIVIKSGHFQNNKEIYGVKNIYSNFDDILNDFYEYSKPYFHKIFCGEGYFVEDMYKSYEDKNQMEISEKLFEDEMKLLKEDYEEEKKKLIHQYLQKFKDYKKDKFASEVKNKDYFKESKEKIDENLRNPTDETLKNDLQIKI